MDISPFPPTRKEKYMNAIQTRIIHLQKRIKKIGNEEGSESYTEKEIGVNLFDDAQLSADDARDSLGQLLYLCEQRSEPFVDYREKLIPIISSLDNIIARMRDVSSEFAETTLPEVHFPINTPTFAVTGKRRFR